MGRPGAGLAGFALRALCGCALAAAAASAAPTRDEVARRWAPVVLQEAGDPLKDLYAAFDFDGDWNGDNQAENLECWSDPARCDTKDNPHSRCAGQACPLIATFYTAVFETPTHLLAVVAKAGGGLGYLQVIETRFHLYWYQYAADIAVTEGWIRSPRPVSLYLARCAGGRGLCPSGPCKYAPGSWPISPSTCWCRRWCASSRRCSSGSPRRPPSPSSRGGPSRSRCSPPLPHGLLLYVARGWVVASTRSARRIRSARGSRSVRSSRTRNFGSWIKYLRARRVGSR